MQLTINSIGKATVDWQKSALEIYRRRIISTISLREHCYPSPKRNKNTSMATLKQREHVLLFETIPSHAYVIALDERGETLTTCQFTEKLKMLNQHHAGIYFLIGGPDGLSDTTRDRSDALLSLSRFTLPHILAKVLLYEQLYRSCTIINNHPYHR